MASNGEAGPSSVSAALDRWREIRLPSLQAAVRELPEQLLAAQKESLVSRKKLADTTRDFKKQSDEGKLEAIKALLKQYQGEIDSLTKRSQHSENAFLRIWEGPQGIKNAPDPYPLLEMLVDQAVAVAEAEALRGEHEALQQSYDQLVRKTELASNVKSENEALQDKVLSLESSLEQKVKDRVQAVEREWEAKFDERLRNQQERAAEATKENKRLQAQVKELRQREEVLTKRGLSGASESASDSSGAQGASAAAAEVEIMVAEVERANRRAAELEVRNETLRAEIASLRNEKGTSPLRYEELEQEHRLLSEQNTKMKSAIDRWEETHRAAVATETKQRQALEKQVESREKELQSLRSRLEKQADYEEVKRELAILRSIEFGGAELDADSAAPTNGHAGSSSSSSLETSLLQKNKKLQDDVATLRVEASEAVNAQRRTAQELEGLKGEVGRLRSLNETLENDLVSVNGPAPRAKASATPTAPAAAAPPASAPPTAAATPNVAAPASTESSMLPIITSQRDRFRTRNAELEEELRKLSLTIGELREEVKTLQADNLGLYEKVRYLQTYGPEQQGANGKARGHTGIPMGGSTSAVMAARTDASGAYPPPSGANFADRREDRYRRKYEERMDPFQAFRGRVSRPPAVLISSPCALRC